MMKSQNKVKNLWLILAVSLVIAIPAYADQVTLDPDGVGFVDDLDPTPDTWANWETVVTDDGDTSFVGTGSPNWHTDLYSLEDTAVSGTINSVTVYVKARAAREPDQVGLQTTIMTGGATYYGTETSLNNTYAVYSTAYNTNPDTSTDWTWADITALQAGVQLRRSHSPKGGAVWSRATQVWVVVDYTPEECEWIEETAWANGTRYVEQGNWATYTPYVADSTVILYAGQTMDAGMVDFSAPIAGSVTITIILNEGWRFYDDIEQENVKIQDYASAPSGNPSPGLFDWKGYATESSFSIDVRENNFYGVHVDVEWEYCE